MKVVNTITISVAKDFSSSPGPRYKREGDFSGEQFRNSILEDKVKQCISTNTKLLIDLDGTAGYGTSFLEESFGGLIRVCKFDYSIIVKILTFKSDEEPYLIEDINAYMEDAYNELK